MKRAIGTIIFLYVIYRLFRDSNEESAESLKSPKNHHPPHQSPLLSDNGRHNLAGPTILQMWWRDA